MTNYHDSYSDGSEYIQASIGRNICTNMDCGLPVRLWQAVADLVEWRRLLENSITQPQAHDIDQPQEE